MEPRRFFVAGEWRTSQLSRAVVNPYTKEVVGEVWQARQPDILEAIGAASRSFDETRRLPSYRRSAILHTIADGLRKRREEIARLITGETGKPILLSRAEVERSILTLTVSAEEAKRIHGEVIPLDLAPQSEGRLGITGRFPLGPIGAITPFNFPLNLVAHKVGPALAVGNPVVLKPSSNAPMTALALGEIVSESGWPAGGLNIIPCSSDEVSELVTSEALKLVTFTGSPAVGWLLKQVCGRKRIVLELGGNAGVIVDSSASLDDAIPRIAMGGFANAGQSCISVQRIFVHVSVLDAFIRGLIEAVGNLQVGDPFDERTVVGPMIDEAAAKKVEGWIGEAVAGGAKVLCGGTRRGAILLPAIVTGVRPDMSVCRQEVFAPLVTVEPFSTIEEAVGHVNDSRYGLQAAIFSNDFRNILYAYRELQVGGVIVNDASSYRIDHMPYGGVKESGFGREGIRYAVEEMSELKLLALRDV